MCYDAGVEKYPIMGGRYTMDTCEPIRLDSYTQKKMTFFFDPDGLPLELHLIAGLLGYSGTHQLSLFMTFVILYNMAYWKYEVPDLNKTLLLIYGHFLLRE